MSSIKLNFVIPIVSQKIKRKIVKNNCKSTRLKTENSISWKSSKLEFQNEKNVSNEQTMLIYHYDKNWKVTFEFGSIEVL